MEVHSLRQRRVDAVLLFSLAGAECAAAADGLSVRVFSLRTFRERLRLACAAACPDGPDSAAAAAARPRSDKKVVALRFAAPLLFCQTNAYTLDVFDLQRALDANAAAPVAPCFSFPINSLNFCKLHILLSPFGAEVENASRLSFIGKLMALKKEEAANKDGATMPDKARYSLPREDESSPPNEFILMATTSIAEDSDQIDVINLSTKTFLVKGVTPSSITIDASDKPCPVPLKTGMVMCLHLFHPTSSSSSTATPPLQLAVGYESGDVILYQISHKAQPWNPQESLSKKSPYSIKIMWSAKLHDQPEPRSFIVIAMDLYKSYLYTASAEEFFTRTNIVLKRGGDGQVQPKFVKTPLPIGSKGASNLVVRKSDGKVVAIACWDSMVRLFSGKSLTPLGIVGAEVHRHGITSLEFVDPVFCINTSAFDETDDTESQQTMGKKTLDKQMRAIEHYGLRAVDDLLPSNMMAVGTSDGRCVLWRVY